jgi:hypothetical protein
MTFGKFVLRNGFGSTFRQRGIEARHAIACTAAQNLEIGVLDPDTSRGRARREQKHDSTGVDEAPLGERSPTVTKPPP